MRAHSRNCETARKHVCLCGGCGGSQHGSGWLDLARAPVDVRTSIRAQFEQKLQTQNGSPRLRQNIRNRAALTDLARVDIADWLASNDEVSTGRSARPDTEETDEEAGVAEADQITALAEEITKATWADIASELGDAPEAKDARRDLAKHGWCDLLVGLIRTVETFRDAIKSIPDAAKEIVKSSILRSTMHAFRANVTPQVVDIVVDRVWQGFKAALLVKSPLLGITSNQTLRALRILAVFICPAPENHEEVRTQALKPLGDDAQQVLTGRTKERLAELFKEWHGSE